MKTAKKIHFFRGFLHTLLYISYFRIEKKIYWQHYLSFNTSADLMYFAKSSSETW